MANNHNLNFNKLAGGFLLAGVIAMTVGFTTSAIYVPKDAAKRGFSIEVAEAEAAEGAGAAAAPVVDIATLMATADAANGGSIASKKCASCHSFDAGGANKVGPNLHGTAGGKIAGKAGFPYSGALKGVSGNWTDENLNHWLLDPQKFAKGTKMVLKVKNDKERADLIAYLKSIK